VDNVTLENFPPAQPTVRKYAVHTMFNF